ncbi:MAG TPA: MoaD/ThiS family protein, partial [Thermoplasmata archaeon]|nr:MoaD/ThiS family protein [Thermoplasmata archaeon]
MPKATVKVPTPLRPFAGGASEIALEGSTVGGLIRSLAESNPSLQRHLFTPDGRLRNFVTIYLNDQDVRYLERESTPLK